MRCPACICHGDGSKEVTSCTVIMRCTEKRTWRVRSGIWNYFQELLSLATLKRPFWIAKKKTSKGHFCEAISAAISSLEKAKRYISICEISGMGRGKVGKSGTGSVTVRRLDAILLSLAFKERNETNLKCNMKDQFFSFWIFKCPEQQKIIRKGMEWCLISKEGGRKRFLP